MAVGMNGVFEMYLDEEEFNLEEREREFYLSSFFLLHMIGVVNGGVDDDDGDHSICSAFCIA
jgi:hypothetical protein